MKQLWPLSAARDDNLPASGCFGQLMTMAWGMAWRYENALTYGATCVGLLRGQRHPERNAGRMTIASLGMVSGSTKFNLR